MSSLATPNNNSRQHSQATLVSEMAEKRPAGSSSSVHSSTHSHTTAPSVKPTPAAAANATAGPSTPKAAPGGPAAMQAPLELSRFRFWIIFLSLMLDIFLFALDQLIVATAIPRITAEFNALTQLPWVASAFFLTLFGFNLLYSQWAGIFPSKYVMMFAVFIFEVGSLVCGVAPSIYVLILGRAIAGVGAAGIFSIAMVIIAEITPLHNRAQYFGLFGVCFALASVIGPLIGGAFTDSRLSWRWCFYINLPLGGAALILQTIVQPAVAPLGQAATYKGLSRDMFWKVVVCDWVGCALAMAWGCCVILALQWGGIERSWKDGGVITCLVLVGVIPVIFILWEKWLGDRAMFKMYLLKRRTIAGASVLLFCLFGSFMGTVYYLSLAFQAVYNNSATQAGVKLLPLILVQIVVLIASSRIIPLIGRFKYIIATGPVFLSVASGLLYTVKYGTPENHLLGFQSLFGIGIGLSMQSTMLAVQFELKKEPRLIPTGTGIATFVGFAGRIVGISLFGSVFGNTLQTELHKYAPDLPADLAVAVLNDATAVWHVVPEQYREQSLMAYTQALRNVYIIGVPLAIIAFIGAMFIKNSRMQTKAEEEAAIKKSREDAAGAPAEGGDAEKAVKADAERAQTEAAEAEAVAAVAPVPAQVVQADRADERV